MNESAFDALRKVSTALENLQIPKQSQPFVHNYIINLFITMLNDKEFRQQIHKDLPTVLREIAKL